MKTILTTLVAGLVAGSAFGQGGVFAFGQSFDWSIVMNTRGGGVDAPVTNALSGERISGTDYLAQLYYGPEGANENLLVPVLDAPGGNIAPPAWFATGVWAGYILGSTGGGLRYMDPAVVVPGQWTAFQLRVWDAASGDTWEEALANFTPTSALGKSDIIVCGWGPEPSPIPLTGLQGFYVGIPEPSVIALGAVGLAVLLWHRRKWSRRFSD